MRKSAIIICCLLFLFFASGTNTFIHANTYLSSATYVPLANDSVQEGSIVSFSPQAYVLSKTPYDQYMVGVVTNSPAISEDIKGPIPSYPVNATGQSFILVSTINGSIRKGDLLTSSIIPGVAMKATKTGYTMGGALEDYNNKNPKSVGKIPISLHIHYFTSNTTSSATLSSLLQNITITNLVFKYSIAGSITVLSLILSFVFITKTANKSIEALGRNPLSRGAIHIGMMFNVIVAIIIVGTGFAITVIMLKM